MNKELDKVYKPLENEDKIYNKWEKSGFFNPDNLNLPESAKNYTIILPPPNITAKLHLGHAAMLAIEDLLVRYKRLKGFRTLWLPGTDHAAIATQNVVEKRIWQEQGKNRHDLGREKFLEEVWSFLGITQATILQQIKKMGASLDWSRLAFTLDEKRQKAVRVMFKNMYDEGVIYRGERLVNWCPRCHSTLADDEVEYKEEKAKLYWLKYGPFVLATTRPETKLGDTAVAVHPGDERYKQYVGKELEIEGVLGKFKVKVVADYAVDKDFGSGAIKVTPAHSFVDDEIARRHNLASKKIINEDGKMMSNCGKYAGLSSREARAAIVSDMEEMGLIDHVDENYVHNSAHCYRCGTVIEPLPSKQWFISVDKKLDRLGGKSLKEKAMEAAQDKIIEFIPSRFEKRYLDWMKNLHDWCISRQIWFGHQIPVWYKDNEIYCGLEKPKDEGWKQDPDTLDTWFSSGMWTFSTLGWPDNFVNGEKVGDLAKFHPTQLLETGYEIITLWVSRMIMMSYFAINEPPFEQVYLHGMVLDKKGKKMSKSKGNGIDPLEMAETFGADAVRLSLLMGSTPGNDTRFSEEKIEAKRNFINKLWNISRFILDYSKDELEKNIEIQNLEIKTSADKWILSSLLDLINKTEENLENNNFSLAAEELNDFTWNKLADWYLEVAKIEKGKEKILIFILRNILKLWHPFIPFVTEVVWGSFNDNLLMVETWPEVNELKELVKKFNDNNFSIIQNIIIAIRNARSENKVEPAKKLEAVIFGHDNKECIAKNIDVIKSLKTSISSLTVYEEGDKIEGSIMATSQGVEIFLIGAFDRDQELQRLRKEEENLDKLIKIQERKLSNDEFVKKAPETVVALERDKLEIYKTEQARIKKAINKL
ncbi:MAG: valine--tRNA ligase [Patescibacteria group bacterium]|nr:valine--tRNA ligase [Patescibacteria group bacterium]